MRSKLLLISIIILPTGLLGQKNKTHWVYLSSEGCQLKAEVLNQQNKMKLNKNYFYTWYSNNKIIVTQGGSDGKFLHGNYKSFYSNNNLKESSYYRFGMKSGKSVYWGEDGKVTEITFWKNGQKNGKSNLYDNHGDLIKTSYFRYDKLNGTEKIISDGKVISKKKFKNGKEVLQNPKKLKETNTLTTTKHNKIQNFFNKLFTKKKNNAPQ
jgi:antitoxin component YwqK of YwqJK toxin-antitoxin module